MLNSKSVLSSITVMMVFGCGGGSTAGDGVLSSALAFQKAGMSEMKTSVVCTSAPNHSKRDTRRAARSAGGDVLAVDAITEYFDAQNCNGSVVAVVALEKSPMAQIEFIETVSNASVRRLSGDTVSVPVDVVRIKANPNGSRAQITGSAVQSITKDGMNSSAVLKLSNTTVTVTRRYSEKQIYQRGFFLADGELKYAVPVEGTKTQFIEIENKFIK